MMSSVCGRRALSTKFDNAVFLCYKYPLMSSDWNLNIHQRGMGGFMVEHDVQ